MEESIELCENNLEAQISLSCMYYSKKDVQGALERINKVIELQKNHPMALRIRAVLYRERGWTESFKDDLKKVKKL